MKIHLHQTHHLIADFEAYFYYLKDHFDGGGVAGIHVFPELFLTGYPLQDLCLQKSFITEYHRFLDRVNEWSKSNVNNDVCLLLGGLRYTMDEETGIPIRIENDVFQLVLGKQLASVYTKILLPNYDIFDERKYYYPGKGASIIEFKHKKIGLLICEDMWPGTYHDIDPTLALKDLGEDLDLVVNLSASPYNLRKGDKRKHRGMEISKTLQAPFVYVNRAGAEDEIIFDGGSFMVNGNDVLGECDKFKADQKSFDLPLFEKSSLEGFKSSELENTWESLFAPALIKGDHGVPKLAKLSVDENDELIKALGFGVQEYVSKSGFSKFLVALSGGLDSALVLAVLKLSLKPGQNLEAIYMPSEFSRDISREFSIDICERIGIKLHQLSIEPLHKVCREMFAEKIGQPLTGLADENIQSRLRGMLLFARSNQSDALVINTSNKSELAVGYSTIYGDSVGAISLLGDVFKSEAFDLCWHINEHHGDIIPEGIITRPPSAELRDDQEDTDSLPPYERLDAILEGILSYRMNAKELIESGFDREEVLKVFNLYRRTEYKRIQFCPIIKVKAKSFGFGYRIPVCKSPDFYMRD